MRPLDNAGEFLMRVRDLSIAKLHSTYEGRMRDDGSRLVAGMMVSLSSDERLHVARSAADAVLHTLLASLEEESAVALTSDGTDVKELSDGLPGELFSERGWISRFSGYPSSVD